MVFQHALLGGEDGIAHTEFLFGQQVSVDGPGHGLPFQTVLPIAVQLFVQAIEDGSVMGLDKRFYKQNTLRLYFFVVEHFLQL